MRDTVAGLRAICTAILLAAGFGTAAPAAPVPNMDWALGPAELRQLIQDLMPPEGQIMTQRGLTSGVAVFNRRYGDRRVRDHMTGALNYIFTTTPYAHFGALDSLTVDDRPGIFLPHYDLYPGKLPCLYEPESCGLLGVELVLRAPNWRLTRVCNSSSSADGFRVVRASMKGREDVLIVGVLSVGKIDSSWMALYPVNVASKLCAYNAKT